MLPVSQVPIFLVPEDTRSLGPGLLRVGCPGGQLHGALPGSREAGLYLQRGPAESEGQEHTDIQRRGLARGESAAPGVGSVLSLSTTDDFLF